MPRNSGTALARNALVAITAASLLGSCSLTLEFEECRQDSDCNNEAGEDLVCNLDTNTCEPRPVPADVLCEDPEPCTSVFGEESTCGPDGECALLTNEQCTKVVFPDGADPDEIVWIGSILATSEPFTEAIAPIENAIELALDDFNSVTSLSDGKKVGWIACDSGGSPSAAEEAARHLIEDVGVPAIIGPTLSEEVLALQPLVVDTNTFVVTPTATAAAIGGLDDNGLIWRTISSDAVQANAIADRIASLDPPPESILVLAKNDEYGKGLFEPMLGRLSEVLPNVPTGSLLYPNPVGLSEDDARSAYATVIADGFAQNADTIVFLGTSEVTEVLNAYLLAWNGSGMQLPRFVMSHGAVPELLPSLQLVVESFRPTLMNALEGVSPNIQDPENFEDFNIRYRVVYSDLNPLSASPLGYDAAIVTLMGLVAGGASGVEIATAMPRLADATGGTPVPMGSQQALIDARELLVAGGNIDIGGVSGPLDFDLVNGEISSTYVGWDVVPVTAGSPDGQLQAARAYVLDGAGPTGSWVEVE
ncbi:MAG: ABC transporter substrate-binding protein [Myxococcota bacterium]